MNIIRYIRKNPKLTKEKVTSFLAMIFGIITIILANFGELIPIAVTGGLTTALTIYNQAITIGLLNTRETIIQKETGSTINEYLGIEEVIEPVLEEYENNTDNDEFKYEYDDGV